MTQPKLPDPPGNDIDEQLLIRNHFGCFLQELSGHIAQGTDGSAGVRRELENRRRALCKCGWNQFGSEHRRRKSERRICRCVRQLSTDLWHRVCCEAPDPKGQCSGAHERTDPQYQSRVFYAVILSGAERSGRIGPRKHRGNPILRQAQHDHARAATFEAERAFQSSHRCGAAFPRGELPQLWSAGPHPTE